MLKAFPAPPRLLSIPSSTRVYLRKMSSVPSPPKIPKFFSVEGSDIHSRSKPDGLCEELSIPALSFLFTEEVDEYDSFYKESMLDVGYSSVYMKRSGQKRDGCGLFYKHGLYVEPFVQNASNL